MLRPSNPKNWHQTQAEIREWQRERDNKRDDFLFIALSDEELELLRILEEKEVIIDEKNRDYAIRMRDLDLIRIFSTDFSDKENYEFCQIRSRGHNYLMYVDKEAAKEKRLFSHNWKITVFSAISGALLSKPLWGILDGIVKMVSNLVRHWPGPQ